MEIAFWDAVLDRAGLVWPCREMLPIIYHPDYQAPLRANHRFPMSKYGYLHRALTVRGLVSPGSFLSPAPAPTRVLELAHDAAYVTRVLDLALDPAEVRRIGLPCTERVVRRSRLSAAGTQLAAWMALERGIACNMAGGSHHAGPIAGAGFCIFNDVAVAALGLLNQGVTPPILVIDADVHQGDGTAEIFADDSRVFTLSIHAQHNYPARKARSDMDVALPDGTDDKTYLDAFLVAIETAFERAQPRLVFYNAGVDVHVQDKLGRLALSDDGIRARDALVFSYVRAHNVPVVGVIGGGYSDEPDALAARHAILFEEAARAAETASQ
ncbi:MAG: histone deacetylase [Paracoccaceae bacterium]